jgi:hypothetical protein
MPVTHSVAIIQEHHRIENRSKSLNIPQYHILILAWSALAILYGETGLSPPFQDHSMKNSFGRVA